ncbi:MAG: hypothetical protein JXA07_04625 [Spirochaetes bacterium]|nr:hypothetical protein [Spirochaetota bacterium]
MTDRTAGLAVVGHRDDVIPFGALGARVIIAGEIEAARRAVRDCADKGVPVILVSDDLLKEMEDIIDRYASSTLPAISALPGPGGDTPVSGERLKRLVKKAIGLDYTG